MGFRCAVEKQYLSIYADPLPSKYWLLFAGYEIIYLNNTCLEREISERKEELSA